jgi:hypothetical protein
MIKRRKSVRTSNLNTTPFTSIHLQPEYAQCRIDGLIHTQFISDTSLGHSGQQPLLNAYEYQFTATLSNITPGRDQILCSDAIDV